MLNNNFNGVQIATLTNMFNTESFFGFEKTLKILGFKVNYSLEPMPSITAIKDGKKYIIINQKYAVGIAENDLLINGYVMGAF